MARTPQLELITEDNVREACGLTVRPEQSHLVAPVAWSLAEAYTVPDIAWPRLITDLGEAVGFVMAAFAPDHPNRMFRCYLWRLNISATRQREGYGRFAVAAVAAEAVVRGFATLSVSYHEGRDGPEGFYAGLGFRPTGEHVEDEAIAELSLTGQGLVL